MSKYLEKKIDVLNKINDFSIDDYINKYPNWKRKLSSTDTYFVSIFEGEYFFAPVKYIMSVNENDHEETNGGIARNNALKLGFSLIEGNAKRYYKEWCLKMEIPYKENNRLLANLDRQESFKAVREYFNIEKKLKELFIINGNKPLQGELGEWLAKHIFDAAPLGINSKGADLVLNNGHRIEVKTKRPHEFNPAGIAVGGNKVYGEKHADFIVFIWLNQDYMIKHITKLSASDILNRYGRKDSYTIKAHEDFPEQTISNIEAIQNIPWRKNIIDEDFLSYWLCDNNN